jgi:hypothetical protein
MLSNLSNTQCYSIAAYSFTDEFAEAVYIASTVASFLLNNKTIVILSNNNNTKKIISDHLRMNDIKHQAEYSINLIDEATSELFLLTLAVAKNSTEKQLVRLLNSRLLFPGFIKIAHLLQNHSSDIKIFSSSDSAFAKKYNVHQSITDIACRTKIEKIITHLSVLHEAIKLYDKGECNCADFFQKHLQSTTLINNSGDFDKIIEVMRIAFRYENDISEKQLTNSDAYMSKIKKILSDHRVTQSMAINETNSVRLLTPNELHNCNQLLSSDVLILSNCYRCTTEVNIDFYTNYLQNTDDLQGNIINYSSIINEIVENHQKACLLDSCTGNQEIIMTCSDSIREIITRPLSIFSLHAKKNTESVEKSITTNFVDTNILKTSFSKIQNNEQQSYDMNWREEQFPKIISTSQCDLLMTDPYAFCLERIFLLKPIAMNSIHMTRGMILHKILAIFFENNCTASEDLISIGEQHSHLFGELNRLAFLAQLRNIEQNFLHEHSNYLTNLNKIIELNNASDESMNVENIIYCPQITGSLYLAKHGITINTIFDRIDILNLNRKQITLVDYKTGTMPSEAALMRGDHLKVGLQAAICLYGDTDLNIQNDLQIENIILWPLTSNAKTKPHVLKNSAKNLADIALSKLDDLLTPYKKSGQLNNLDLAQQSKYVNLLVNNL